VNTEVVRIGGTASNNGLTLTNGLVLSFTGATLGNGVSDARDLGLSRLAAGSMALGNGTNGDFTGSLKLKAITVTDTAANTDVTIQNTTAATSGTSQSSPLVSIAGNYWTGAASATDSWTLQTVETNGTNGNSNLTLVHSGSTGTAAFAIGTP